jgi:hypothetical protein
MEVRACERDIGVVTSSIGGAPTMLSPLSTKHVTSAGEGGVRGRVRRV